MSGARDRTRRPSPMPVLANALSSLPRLRQTIPAWSWGEDRWPAHRRGFRANCAQQELPGCHEWGRTTVAATWRQVLVGIPARLLRPAPPPNRCGRKPSRSPRVHRWKGRYPKPRSRRSGRPRPQGRLRFYRLHGVAHRGGGRAHPPNAPRQDSDSGSRGEKLLR